MAESSPLRLAGVVMPGVFGNFQELRKTQLAGDQAGEEGVAE